MTDDPANPGTEQVPSTVCRRALLAAGGLAASAGTLALAGCAMTYDPGSGSPAADATGSEAPKPGATSSTPDGGPGGASGASGVPLGPAASVPVGGGVIYPAQQVVVTQPTAGVFRAFSAVCTHARCLVTNVTKGVIYCPCHGSTFAVTDGSVRQGPATRGLPTIRVTEDGGNLRIG